MNSSSLIMPFGALAFGAAVVEVARAVDCTVGAGPPVVG